MKLNKIENRIAFFIITLGIFLLNFKNLTLLSLFISHILALLLINLFDKVKLYNFKICKFIIFILSIIFLIYYLNKTSYFINNNMLRNYSTIFINFSIFLSIFILSFKEYNTIIKVILLSSYFIIFTLLIGIIFNISYLNFSNLTIDIFNKNNIFFNSIFYSILIVFAYFLIYPISNTKFKNKDLIISGLYQIFTYILIFSILGNTLTSLYKYPYIIVFKKVNLIGFIERIETIFSMNYLFTFYFLLLLMFYQIKYILKKVIKKDKNFKISIFFLSLLIYLISLTIF